MSYAIYYERTLDKAKAMASWIARGNSSKECFTRREENASGFKIQSTMP